ncbi:MAG: rod shape-determining protein MreC [Gammaproteobacteria bacterium]
MVFDHRNHNTQDIRKVLSIVVAPIQYMVDMPMRAIDWLQTSLTSKQALILENAHLHAQQTLLKAKVQQLLALEKENNYLRALLKSSPRAGGDVVVAQLLAVDSDPFVQQIVLDKGTQDNIYVGQPVLDANGVMGQIIQVGPLTSHVLLITDTRSAVPVVVNRNGVRAIAVGTGSLGVMALQNVSKTTDIRQGDVLLTSGLGQRFPPGYPVGIISKINKNAGDHFATVEVKPSAHLDRSRLVLLVWPSKEQAEKLAAINFQNQKAQTNGN